MRTVRWCTRCLMPDTRPRVVFSPAGVCNACLNAENKPDIDWEARRREFEELVAPYRRSSGWDCIVPWSGGKDSSSIAWRLKFELGMRPLLVTFSPLLPTPVGQHNREALVRAGFDHLLFRPDQRIHRRLARRFFIERGNHKVAWDAGINALPVQVAVRFRIPLIFYAEHGETEYGGKVLGPDSARQRDFTEVIEHQVGDDPRNWTDEEVSPGDLAPYLYPDPSEVREVGVTALYFAWFFRWSMYDNYRFIRSRIDFRTCAEGRTQGTFTDFDSLDDEADDLYYHLQYIKFGFGRAVRDASRMIQNGHLTREEGLELARRYDAEFPSRFLDHLLDYLSLDRTELERTLDLHRNPELWTREGSEWRLRFPVR